jgi:hypothetical protein
MFLVNQTYCTYKQLELHRRADQYRMMKSMKKQYSVLPRVKEALGKQMIKSGQLLVNRAQTAYS